MSVQSQRLETTDIYKSAVFLCNGGRLAGVRFKERKRGIVSFLIEGDGILQVDLDYRNGSAQVNALQLRHTLNHLRDVLFTRLREQGERKHGNRTGGHRSGQAY
ncbi:hypothetical protein DSCA_61090 [Desulfosarcina alkanivorans]|uniref:DUF5659 domain-containing protein n=1 Tax=Desulfosarcina alkanivorans TaxID=571177 RepID=A0A5K7YVV8_9BACT|nr:hypothetical protein DSCA_61090 [Desulfosarcina alkanivorans]